jgi:hypothetical protein
MPKRLLFLALLALTLVACGGSDDPGTGGSSGGTVTSGGDAPSLNAEQDLARLLSGDVVLAIRADVAHIRASTLYPKLVELIRSSQDEPANADFTVAMLEHTEEVAFGGGVDAAGPDPHLTAMRGRYDQAELERFAGLRPDAVAATYRGVALFNAGGESLTLISGRLFLLGSTAQVHAAIDRLAETAPTPGGVAARLLDDAALSGAPIAVALVAYDELRRKIAEGDEVPRELRSLVGGSATVDLSAGFAATAAKRLLPASSGACAASSRPRPSASV